MCLSQVPLADILAAALAAPISTETWALLDECQRPDLPPSAYQMAAPAGPDAHVPLHMGAVLTPLGVAADERRDAELRRVEQRIDALYASPAPRHLSCGRGGTAHCRRTLEDGRVEDILIRMRCGRSDYPYCWRRRVCLSYRRAAGCVLDAPGELHLPRVESLHMAGTTWAKWEALDHSIRRRHGGKCGRLRIRRTDGTVLVVAAQPFRGATAVAPHEACAAVVAAIDVLHDARHSYRQMGEWSDRHGGEWHSVGRYTEALDLGEVQATLAAAEVKSRLFAAPGLSGLIWRCDSEAAAAKLTALIRPHSASASEYVPPREISISRSYSVAPSQTTPSYPVSAPLEDDPDPEPESPWR